VSIISLLIADPEIILPTKAHARYGDQIDNYLILLRNTRSWQVSLNTKLRRKLHLQGQKKAGPMADPASVILIGKDR
jgi:hypothetical protein